MLENVSSNGLQKRRTSNSELSGKRGKVNARKTLNRTATESGGTSLAYPRACHSFKAPQQAHLGCIGWLSSIEVWLTWSTLGNAAFRPNLRHRVLLPAYVHSCEGLLPGAVHETTVAQPDVAHESFCLCLFSRGGRDLSEIGIVVSLTIAVTNARMRLKLAPSV
jgi:hypothetical protein